MTYNAAVIHQLMNMSLLMPVIATLLLAAGSPVHAQEKRVLGMNETVRIEPEGLLVVALLDTGATTTSLDARAIRVVERDGKQWVEFEYHQGGHITAMARPLVRISNLRPAPGVSERRPVVMLRLCVGGVHREVPVNLVDRSKGRARMLIGRNFLIPGQIIVDPALKLTAPPCDGGNG